MRDYMPRMRPRSNSLDCRLAEAVHVRYRASHPRNGSTAACYFIHGDRAVCLASHPPTVGKDGTCLPRPRQAGASAEEYMAACSTPIWISDLAQRGPNRDKIATRTSRP